VEDLDRNMILETARAIRAYLPELRANDSAEVDATIAALLIRSSRGEDVTTAVLGVLRADENTWQWFIEFAPKGLPADVAGLAERGFAPAPGGGEPVSIPRFVCPVGNDYLWYRRAVGQQPPVCPTHGVPLVRG
jgi:hypothetical protein